ncbi:S8 family serine peptidase [Clostridium perfringens]|uniref:S8 family serine peptidase n=1 Tax=Clostridium perfringens TaxID=1502 RepID=UPI000D70907B|nr:S8 family serine peptidase [Clostridium perfringens]PWX37128.1 subtilase [Clostridium perfringens]PWX52775.1 subtilase [Clostridium perfringens]PWX69087.1 subtilase [Clostridium perfringens]
MKSKIRIVVIDSGIDSNSLDCVKESISLDFDEDNRIIESLDDKVNNEHGTIISLIINSVFKEIELISIKILDENLLSNIDLLIYSLEKALSYNPDIIHMSLGTKKWRYKYKLRKLINNILNRNIVVVSAVSNDGKTSYPAYFKNVIGVKQKTDREKRPIYYMKNFYYAKGEVSKSVYKNANKYLVGNSFAAAYITGYVAKVLYYKNFKNIDQINKYLKGKLKF